MHNKPYEEIPIMCSYTPTDAIEDGVLVDPAALVATVDDDTGEPEYVKDLADIQGIDDYLKSYGKILGKKAIHALKPLHVPFRDPLIDFSDIVTFAPNREPFPCQARVITGTVKMMDQRGSGFICGECGTGKTEIGMVAVHKHAQRSRKQGGLGGNYRGLVVCPDHLIEKWEREIKETLPARRSPGSARFPRARMTRRRSGGRRARVARNPRLASRSATSWPCSTRATSGPSSGSGATLGRSRKVPSGT